MDEKQFLDDLSYDSLLWGRTLFPEHFRSSSPYFHYELSSLADSGARYIAVAAPRESAKAQSLDSNVLTPLGWKQFKDLAVGDTIIGGDGNPTKIISMTPITEMNLYRVSFQCGASTVCNQDHLWEVYCPSNMKKKKLVLPLWKIVKNYKAKRYDHRFKTHYFESRYFIKNNPAIEFPEKKLPIDPYTLGCWLGDGHAAGSRITSADPEIFSYMPFEVRQNKAKYNYNVIGLLKLLRANNLLKNKHIPKEYLFSSIKQREALLQGLIDTDGHIPNRHTCIDFSNTNKRLITEVQHLVRSLGGRAHLRPIVTSCNGQKFDAYRLFIWLSSNIAPSKLSRKLARYTPFQEINNRIKDISFEKRGLGRCITVDNADGIYITDDFIRTHNSTLLVFNLPINRICYKKKRFIIIISNTFGKAAKHLQTIKEEITHNNFLYGLHGKITLEKDAEGDAIFVHPDGFKTEVLCKGYEQIPSIRGLKFGAYRPDLIIGDDMEDDEMVLSQERRKKLQDDFDTALIPAGDRDTCQFIFIGTILHDDALIAKLINPEYYHEYKKIKYIAHIDADTPQERSLWNEKWTVEQLKEIRKQKPATYAKELQNDPVAGGERRFNRKDFCYWRLLGGEYAILDSESRKPIERGSFKDCKGAIACDLAWSEKRTADRTVLMPGLLTPGNTILLLEYVHQIGLRPDRIADYLFTMVDRLEKLTGNYIPVGLEKAMLENVTKWVLREEMKKRNKPIVTKELLWDKDKLARIESRLMPRYSQHMIYHLENMGDLEHQLERFPYGTHDDLIDAEQGLVQLLQYPKAPSKDAVPEDNFNWWRNQAKRMKEKPKTKFAAFRTTNKPTPKIPAKISWR